MIRKEKGITLLALGITIIVLLILSGVIIAAVSGENGVIQRTIAARQEQEKAQYKDFIDTAVAKAYMADWKGEQTPEELLGTIEQILQNEDYKEYFEGATFDITTQWGEPEKKPVLIIITKEKYEFKVVEEGSKFIGKEEDIGNMATIKTSDVEIVKEPSTWTNQNVKVKIEVKNEDYKGANYIIKHTEDLNSEWKIYDKENGFEVAQNTPVHIRITNEKLGLDFITTRDVEIIDKVKPTIIDLTRSAITWNGATGTITLTGEAQDFKVGNIQNEKNSGINAYQFSMDQSLTAESEGWLAITPTTEEITKTKEVTNANNGTWYFYVKDQAGNVEKEEIEVLIRDITKPDISLTPSTTAWTSGTVTLTGKSQDAGSGIVGYAWTTTATAPTNWVNVSQTNAEVSQTTTLSANGTIYFWTKDAVGNINNAAVTVSNIDKTAPAAATIELSSTYATGAITARVTHSDANSGVNIASCKYVFNTTAGAIGTNAGSYNGTFSSNGQTISLTPSVSGYWYLHVLTVDNVGNPRETISAAADLHVHTNACYSTVCTNINSQANTDTKEGIIEYTCSHTHTYSGEKVGLYSTMYGKCYTNLEQCHGEISTWDKAEATKGAAGGRCEVCNKLDEGMMGGTSVRYYKFSGKCNICGKELTRDETYYKFCSSNCALRYGNANFSKFCNGNLYGLSCGMEEGQKYYARFRHVYACPVCKASTYYAEAISESNCPICKKSHYIAQIGIPNVQHRAIAQYTICGR